MWRDILENLERTLFLVNLAAIAAGLILVYVYGV
jgi:hypothetical protein